MELTSRQQVVFDLIKQMSANNALKITNQRLAKELADRKGMTGFNGNPVHFTAVSRFLKILEDSGYIKVIRGKNTRENVINILKN